VAAGNYVYNVNLSHLDEWATLPELRQIGQVKRTDALWVFMDPNCEYLRPVGVGGGWFCLVTADWNNVNGGQTWPHGKFPIDGVANVVMLDGHVESFNQTTHRANYLANPPRPPLYQWGDAQ
jgi:prepilin-type processing-associated H-X9-DG protein